MASTGSLSAIPPASGIDHLSALPPELLHHIIAHLFPTHYADLALRPRPRRPTRGNSHPLDYLSATSKTLRLTVHDWARSWLLQHSPITKFIDRQRPKPTHKRTGLVQLKKQENKSPAMQQHNYLRARQSALLTWCHAHCIFCGKSSKRNAILMNGFRCCTSCDKTHWPDKITKSSACEEFDLKNFQLTPQHYLDHQHQQPPVPGLAKHLAKFPDLPVPPVSYGTYFACNVPTTMLLREDVRKLAEIIHGGDLKAHLAARKQRRDGLKEKKGANAKAREAKKVAREAEEAREAQQRAGQAAQGRQSTTAATAPIEISDDEYDSEDEDIPVSIGTDG